ncbi:hypothetical protein PMAYCL1PPCAC_04189, partial [Pristionchus mayeri]
AVSSLGISSSLALLLVLVSLVALILPLPIVVFSRRSPCSFSSSLISLSIDGGISDQRFDDASPSGSSRPVSVSGWWWPTRS